MGEAVTERIEIDVAAIRAQIDRLIIANPELAEDEALLLDTLEGETEMHALASRLLDAEAEASANVLGIENRESSLSIRKARFNRTAIFLRGLLLSLMEISRIDKLVLPEATVSITKGRQNAVIDDESQIPQGFIRIEKTILKKEIAVAIKAGEYIPGVHMEPTRPSLTIRRK